MTKLSRRDYPAIPTLARRWGMRALLGGGLALASSVVPATALACGGFFCSAAAPVNQAAERIVFAKNDDGTVTAVIEIQYEGPSTSFSWLLPIAAVPEGNQLKVASNAAFQRLQQLTNPQYNLQLRVEGSCDAPPRLSGGGSQADSGASFSPGNANSGASGGVTIEASGAVGPYDWAVISLDESLTDPASAAVTWLGKNGYDVPGGAPALLGPYLQDGLYLLALKLQKGVSTGSIRPIALTYPAEKPMIPLKLTAVAANENMGVLAWILGNARAVPENYNALELNEARINWFNASANYNAVVSAAANDAGGQGFVTELAGTTDAFKAGIWTQSDDLAWQRVQGLGDSTAAYEEAKNAFQGYDGFWEVVENHVTFPGLITIDDVKACPYCGYQVEAVDQSFVTALGSEVIEPMRLLENLIAAHPKVTRLYTTMSAAEMTVDPLFTFNWDLAPVSNLHTAQRIIECGPGYYQSDAPWRIELPNGGVVRGGPDSVGTWPSEFDAQPPNRLITRQSASGTGKVIEDNTTEITAAVNAYSKSVPAPPRHDSSCSSSGRAPGGGLALALAALILAGGRRRLR